MIWYQTWIIIHSTALRSLPLTMEHFLKLGLIDDEMLQIMFSNQPKEDQNHRQAIISRRDDGERHLFRIPLSSPFKIDLPSELGSSWYKDSREETALRVRIREFGHLAIGQNFRGR